MKVANLYSPPFVNDSLIYLGAMAQNLIQAKDSQTLNLLVSLLKTDCWAPTLSFCFLSSGVGLENLHF